MGHARKSSFRLFSSKCVAWLFSYDPPQPPPALLCRICRRRYSCSDLRFQLIQLSVRPLTNLCLVAEALGVDQKSLTKAVNHVSEPKEQILGLIANAIDTDGDEVSDSSRLEESCQRLDLTSTCTAPCTIAASAFLSVDLRSLPCTGQRSIDA